MSEDTSYEDELIRLSEIFETLKKDALEVSDLLVKGIDYYKILSFICIIAGIALSILMWTFLSQADLLQGILYLFFSVTFIASGIYGLYKHRRLKKKYAELIEIQKSLAEK